MKPPRESASGQIWNYRLVNSSGNVLDEAAFGDDGEAIRWATSLIGTLNGFPIGLERFAQTSAQWEDVFKWQRFVSS